MFYLLSYVSFILLINISFAYIPLIELPSKDLWSPVSLMVGFVFVVRDFAQRHIGHHILWGMLMGCVLSWYFATPALAVASAAAFAVGELADWLIFTFTKKTFSQRILLSSIVGAPLDSLIFLILLNIATPVGIITMTLSKLMGAFVVYYFVRKREMLTTTEQEKNFA